MPIDNDYFKNRQKENKGSKNSPNNSGGGDFQPPFETPEFFKGLSGKGGAFYAAIKGHL